MCAGLVPAWAMGGTVRAEDHRPGGGGCLLRGTFPLHSFISEMSVNPNLVGHRDSAETRSARSHSNGTHSDPGGRGFLVSALTPAQAAVSALFPGALNVWNGLLLPFCSC